MRTFARAIPGRAIAGQVTTSLVVACALIGAAPSQAQDYGGPFRTGAAQAEEPRAVTPVDEQPTLPAAAAAGDAAMVQALIGAGAAVDARDATGRTALNLASRSGFAPIVVDLLRAGADVNSRNSAGITPLIAAAANGRLDAARILLANCADVDARDIRGRTALHFASARGYTDVAELLIRNGADVKARQGAGATPFRTAVSFQQPEIMALLRANGAQTYVPSPEERAEDTENELARDADELGTTSDAATPELPDVSATAPIPLSIRERVRPASRPRGTVGTTTFVQEKLAELGYDPGPADGRMGEKTRASVEAFASETGIYGSDYASGEITRCLVERLQVETALRQIDAERQPEEGLEDESLSRERFGGREPSFD